MINRLLVFINEAKRNNSTYLYKTNYYSHVINMTYEIKVNTKRTIITFVLIYTELFMNIFNRILNFFK